MKHRQTLAIDPGLQGTGLAFWSQNKIEPDWVAVLKYRGKSTDVVTRGMYLAEEVQYRLTEGEVDVVEDSLLVCELMELHQSARAQMMWKAGDLQHTLVLIGMIAAHCYSNVSRVQLVKPSQWKGQLPKSIVERRLRAKLGKDACRRLEIESHAWDAVGIGLWAMGRF